MSSSPSSLVFLQQSLVDAAESLYQGTERLPQPLFLAAQAIVNSLTSGGKVICAGQGHGAWLARQATHMLVRGMLRPRPPLAALCLGPSHDPDAEPAPGSLSSGLTALGQAGDIWLAFAGAPDCAELMEATRVARDLDMILLVLGPENDTGWQDVLRDTDMWLGLPGALMASQWCTGWMALLGLCEAIDVHLLGEDN